MTHVSSRLVHAMNPLIVKGMISKPADYRADRNFSSSASDVSNRSAQSDDEDLGSDMEIEARISSDYFEECLNEAEFINKHTASGLLYSERIYDSNLKRQYLTTKTLRNAKSHRMLRPEFMKQVLRQGTWAQLEEKLKLTPAAHDRDIFPFGRIEIQDSVEECLKSNDELNSNVGGFRGSVIALMMSIKCYSQVPNGHRLNIHQETNLEYIAWGLLAKKSRQLLHTDCGCIGRCDYVLKGGSDERPFAVFEFKKLSSPDYNTPWYKQAKPWVLQVFNSFVGSDAEIGGALAPDCFFLLWRVETSRTHRRPTTGHETITVEGDLTDSTYDYYALDTTHLQPITDDNIDKLANFFVELARICGSLEKLQKKRSASEISEKQPNSFGLSSTIPKRTPKSEGNSKPPSGGVKRSWITQIGKGEDLPVAAVDPAHFFTEVELESIFEAEDELELKMEELGIRPDY
jgi:hypothetical protein